MWQIELTPEAIDDLAALRKFDQVRVVGEMESQLTYEPANETRNRKRLRPNQLAEWALRIDNLRVFYDVIHAGSLIKVIAIGRKEGSRLFIRDQEFEL